MVTDYFYFAAGRVNYLNATEDETIEFGTPKVDIENYPSNYAEQWILIVPEGRKVQIDFDIFELEDSEDCKNDYVEFREASIMVGDPKRIYGHFGPILTNRLWFGFSSWVTETLSQCTRDSKLLLKQVCHEDEFC